MRLAALLLAMGILTPRQDAVPPPPRPPFEEWLQGVIDEAHARGFSDQLIDSTLTGLTPIQRVVERDGSQAEFPIPLDRYFATRVTPRIIRLGRQHAVDDRMLLQRIRAEYGVPPGVVLAVWGMESHYGEFTGTYPVFQSLATLAYEPRRADFFRGELFKALSIVQSGFIDARTMTGSWAGAMGQPQFLPSSYLQHAVDFDRAGLRDIWHSRADTLASIASYLKNAGWEAGQAGGREVKVSPAAREAIATIPTRDAGCSAQRLMTERRPADLR